VGRERIARFELEGPGIRHWFISAATRAPEAIGNPIPVKEPYGWDFYGSPFDHLAVSARPIRGIVREKETGRPVVNAVVSSLGYTLDRAKTDAQGRFELLGYPKSGAYHLTASPPQNQPLFTITRRVADAPGLGPLEVDFELARGISVKGRLTDQETGKPVKGEVAYFPLYPNPNVITLGDHLRVDRPCSQAVTEPDGSYMVVALPGPGVVTIASWSGRWDRYVGARVDPKELKRVAPHTRDFDNSNVERGFLSVAAGGQAMSAIVLSNYNDLTLINPPEGAPPIRHDVALRSGRTVAGVVVGPDGKPLAGVRILGTTSHHFEESITASDGAFEVKALDPRGTRTLNFFDAAKNLSLSTEVRGDQTGPLTIRLQAYGSATGQLLDEDGHPLKDLVLHFYRPGLMGPGEATTRTDAKGVFRVLGLVPGQKYEPRYSRDRQPPYPEFSVASGEVKNLGVARVKP
jgi:hypothetical protein